MFPIFKKLCAFYGTFGVKNVLCVLQKALGLVSPGGGKHNSTDPEHHLVTIDLLQTSSDYARLQVRRTSLVICRLLARASGFVICVDVSYYVLDRILHYSKEDIFNKT